MEVFISVFHPSSEMNWPRMSFKKKAFAMTQKKVREERLKPTLGGGT
jgi:hypothetical protein